LQLQAVAGGMRRRVSPLNFGLIGHPKSHT